MESRSITTEVDELIKAQKSPVKPVSPKRNSKDDLIQKILKLADDVGEDIEETDSQLRRMSKRALTEKLAKLVERRIEFEAQKALGITNEQAQSPYMVNLAALKMVHSIAVSSAENIVDRTSNRHGMTLQGFSDRMKDCQESVDQILMEIAELYPDVIEKFSSPWVRLGLLWGSNVMVSLKKKTHNNKYAPSLRPTVHPRVNSI